MNDNEDGWMKLMMRMKMRMDVDDDIVARKRRKLWFN